MITFYSKFHDMYVAQKMVNGYLFTGRGEQRDEAITRCMNAIKRHGLK